MAFKKGQKVVKAIDIHGAMTATIQTISKVSKGVIALDGSSLKFDANTGREIDPAFFQFHCYLVPFDGGEIERWGLKGSTGG